jgi:predicted metalloprotease with PDZ domain
MSQFFAARALRRGALAVVLVAVACVAAGAQQSADAYRIAYELRLSQPASHLFEVRMTVETPTPREAVDFQLPRWSPGRYAVFDFAKNVREVWAQTDCPAGERCDAASARPLRVDTQTWRVPMRGAQKVVLTYKVFGDDLSGTFAQLDERHANYNGGELFMYVVEHKSDPVTLSIEPPAGWRIVNGRIDAPDQRVWQFPNYDIMIDTPTEIGPDWTMDEFKLDGKTYHVVLHAVGGDAGKRKKLTRELEKIVRAETAMWGAPEFDDYTFLIHTGAQARGDGMEHLTSTQIIVRSRLDSTGTLEEVLGTAAHEFFHVWNVKRLRPVELGPWDFTRPLNTRGLWIAEGFTNYYGHLMQRRADLWDDQTLYRVLAGEISTVEDAPGSRLMSAEESSLSAPFLDLACHVQETNLSETAISYYDKGEVLALTLDLLIRGRSDGRISLDDVMRRAYRVFYLDSRAATYYLRGRGYTQEEFQRVASEAAGFDLSDFFARHVRATEPPPYDEAFAYVGLRLVKPNDKEQSGRVSYSIEELPNASARAKELRRAWLRGNR